MTGDDVFKAMLEAGVVEIVRKMTPADQGQLALAVMGRRYRALPPKVRDGLEAVARVLERETT